MSQDSVQKPSTVTAAWATIGRIGIPVQCPPVQLTEECNLEYYDGPLLSLFRDEAGSAYIGLWNNWDHPGLERWLFFLLAEPVFSLYFQRKITLLDALLAAPSVIVRDDEAVGSTMYFVANVSDIPHKDRPTAESFLPSGIDASDLLSEGAVLS